MFTEARERFLSGARTVLPRVPAISVAIAGVLYAETLINPLVVAADGGPCIPPHSECPLSMGDGNVPGLLDDPEVLRTYLLSEEIRKHFQEKQNYSNQLAWSRIQLVDMHSERDFYRGVTIGLLLGMIGVGVFSTRRFRVNQSTK